MTKKLKLSLLGLGTTVATVAPLTLAVSCGSGGSTSVNSAMGVPLNINPNNAKIWMIGDGGSVQDKSFNESALAGVAEYGNGYTDNGKTVAPTPYSYIQPKPGALDSAYSSALRSGGEILVGAGFMHGDSDYSFGPNGEKTPTTDAEKGAASKALDANPDKWFLAVDVDYSSNPNKHMAGVTYDTQKPGFWAGVYTAKYLNEQYKANPKNIATPESLDVAMYGGGTFPSVLSWMSGFERGVKAANLKHPNVQDWKTVNILPARVTTDNFASPSTQAADLTRQFVRYGADVVFPVAGPQIQDSLLATAGSAVKIIGVDGDQEAVYGGSRIIGSALKYLQRDIKEGLDAFYSDTTTDKAGFVSEYHDQAHKGHVGFITGSGDDKKEFGEQETTDFLGSLNESEYGGYFDVPYGFELNQDGSIKSGSIRPMTAKVS